eukprot:3341195-Prymnesium_polylepis.1
MTPKVLGGRKTGHRSITPLELCGGPGRTDCYGRYADAGRYPPPSSSVLALGGPDPPPSSS